MIHSMTGFGTATVQSEAVEIQVEIRTLNSKQLDVNFKLPSVYRSCEVDVRNLLAAQLHRGKIAVNVQRRTVHANASSSINKEVLMTYYRELKTVQDELDINESSMLRTLLSLPDVLEQQEEKLDENETKAVLAAVKEATQALVLYRQEEGETLRKDLTANVGQILIHLEAVESMAPQRIEAVRERIQQAFKKYESEDKIDQGRLEQELVYYLEKLDVNEEVVRLRSHCDYFLETMQSDQVAVGKKLGFIGQEMGREINTLGSKANDAPIQKKVILMKEELEKIKEQTLNVV